MTNDIKLYIDKKLVEFQQEIDFPITYQISDLTNPTIVKNCFSKSIVIDGTDNNNAIFGEIYNLDRKQKYDFVSMSGVDFNPTKRTPFELYINNNLAESGYIELNNIKMKGSHIQYEITLFGGLGDFLYNLMYNDDNVPLTLADLDYNLNEDFQFNINKEFVNECWENTCKEGDSLSNLISFVPSYNGLHNDFSNDTFIVNTVNNSAITISSKTENNVTYTPYEGYSVLKSEKEYTEWETRDLRSYTQRPAIRFKKVMDAICNPINNGGYTVNLDESFFNPSNPYYYKSYIALPLLENKAEENITTEMKAELMVNSIWVGEQNNTIRKQYATSINLTGETITTTVDGLIDMTNIPVGSLLNLKVAFDLTANIATNPKLFGDEMYLTSLVSTRNKNNSTTIGNVIPHYNSIIVQAYIQDADTLEYLYTSEWLNFTNGINYFIGVLYSQPSLWVNHLPLEGDMKLMNGRFVKTSDKQYKFKLYENDASTFVLNINNVPRRNRMKITLLMKYGTNETNTDFKYLYSNEVIVRTANGIDTNTQQQFNIDNYRCASNVNFNVNTNASEFSAVLEEPILTSNQIITKDWLLKTDFTPADMLLSFTKLFGLMYIKDVQTKTINILSKNTFYTNDIKNIEDKIDWGKEVKITPTLMTSKYIIMKNESNETYFDKLYKKQYNQEYGQKRIDTNYNFNSEEKDVYDGNVLNNVVTVLDDSSYYRTFYNKNNFQIPSCVNDSPVLKLYNGVNTEDRKEIEITDYNPNIVNYQKIVPWNEKDGYDFFAKICCYEKDNNEKSLSDLSAALVIYNGEVETKDINGTSIPYWVTDDTYQMFMLNEEPCWIYTESEQDYNFNKIAIKRTTLPQFTRYNIESNVITDSLDFGRPQEIYFFNKEYNEDSTLFNKFWKNYLYDMYDVNTRVLTCYVKFDDIVNYNTLKNYYYFRNSYWVINKIEESSPLTKNPVKVEFVKVNDIGNYQAQTEYFYPTVQLNKYDLTVNYNSTKSEIILTSNNPWKADVIGEYGSVEPSYDEAGEWEIEVKYPTNTDVAEKEYKFKFYIQDYGVKYLTIHQTPNPDIAVMIEGYVYKKEEKVPVVNARVVFDTYEATTDANGYYKLYFPKSSSAFVDVYDSNNTLIAQTAFNGSSTDTMFNIKVYDNF